MDFKIYHIPTQEKGQIYSFPAPLAKRVNDFACNELKALNVDIVINLLSEYEKGLHEMAEQKKHYKERGIELIEYPIQDFNTPKSVENFRLLIKELRAKVTAGKSVGVHCMAGIGRTGILTVSLLSSLGMDVQKAMQHVSKHRERQIPDTLEQRQWLEEFNQ